MHSSRMRTARFSGRLCVARGLPRGCLPKGVCPGVCVWGCLPRGCLPGGVCLGGCLPHPSPRGQTDAFENITLPQTSFAGGNY